MRASTSRCITKDTEAWIARNVSVTVTGNVTVDATSSEKLTSLAVGGGFGGTAAVNVNVGVSVINITTKAFIADARHRPLGAQDHTRAAACGSAPTRSSSSTSSAATSPAAARAAVGAAAAVPVITKETHA